jgi:imidazoleglycerol-phosphate dehydratase
MDETLVLAAVDISGRGYLGYALDIPTEKVGDFDTELVDEFFSAFVRNARLSLHLRQFEGRNSHHIIEAAFKAFARALSEATGIDPDAADRIPSTKGMLV